MRMSTGRLPDSLPVRLSRVAVGAALLMAASRAGGAQVAYDSPAGRVEVLGLRHWTLAMLQDSIRRYVPGQELHDAACMITLRDSLHFVDASVDWFQMTSPGQPTRSLLAVKVIEPTQASRVQWDVHPRDEFTSLIPDYAPLILSVTDSTGAVWRGRLLNWLQLADNAQRAAALARNAAARADGERMFAFLADHRADADRVRAMRVLARDGLWVNRMIAVGVLSEFSQHDSTWWAMVRALRDPHEGVRSAVVAPAHALACSRLAARHGGSSAAAEWDESDGHHGCLCAAGADQRRVRPRTRTAARQRRLAAGPPGFGGTHGQRGGAPFARPIERRARPRADPWRMGGMGPDSMMPRSLNMKAERLEKEFASRSVPHRAGLLLFQPDDAIDLVRTAADEGVPILGLDGFRVTKSTTESPPEHLADYSDRVAAGHGCWQEAEAFIRERQEAGLLFEVTLGDDPIEAV